MTVRNTKKKITPEEEEDTYIQEDGLAKSKPRESVRISPQAFISCDNCLQDSCSLLPPVKMEIN